MVVLSMAFISLLLAGSRTYIFSFFLIIFFNVLKDKITRILIVIASSGLLVDFFMSEIYKDFSSSNGSMFVKNEILSKYIEWKTQATYPDYFGLLLGGEYGIQFDSDLGYIIGAWGIIGLICVLGFGGK